MCSYCQPNSVEGKHHDIAYIFFVSECDTRVHVSFVIDCTSQCCETKCVFAMHRVLTQQQRVALTVPVWEIIRLTFCVTSRKGNHYVLFLVYSLSVVFNLLLLSSPHRPLQCILCHWLFEEPKNNRLCNYLNKFLLLDHTFAPHKAIAHQYTSVTLL